MIMRNTVLE